MWMLWAGLACDVTPIEDGASIGPLTQVKTSFTSALIGVTPEGAAIAFDAGFNRRARPIERTLEASGLTLDDVSMVFLTHSHTDHVAGLDALGGEVVAHELEVPLLEEEGIEVDRTLVDAEVVDIGGWSVEVLHVPGHTPGSAVYLVEGVLVMGDVAIQQRDGTVGPPGESFSEDPAEAQAELCRLVERVEPRRGEIDVVAYAHSGPSDVAGLIAAEGCDAR